MIRLRSLIGISMLKPLRKPKKWCLMQYPNQVLPLNYGKISQVMTAISGIWITIRFFSVIWSWTEVKWKHQPIMLVSVYSFIGMSVIIRLKSGMLNYIHLKVTIKKFCFGLDSTPVPTKSSRLTRLNGKTLKNSDKLGNFALPYQSF